MIFSLSRSYKPARILDKKRMLATVMPVLVAVILAVTSVPVAACAQGLDRKPIPRPEQPTDSAVYVDADVLVAVPGQTEATDSLVTEVRAEDYPYGLDGKIPFNPSPTRAAWLSALCPGLGQIYNRRYWKLPIIVGGFMGLGYATSWNNTQYKDYMQGYRDLLDDDPDTKSYMNFFPPNTDEGSLDTTWLTQTFQKRKDYYRRNRDLCIICLAALYVLCMLDSYIDASMAHFDLSPDLSLDVRPAIILHDTRTKPSLGLNWAFTF